MIDSMKFSSPEIFRAHNLGYQDETLMFHQGLREAASLVKSVCVAAGRGESGKKYPRIGNRAGS
jgi:hypothetical protein